MSAVICWLFAGGAALQTEAVGAWTNWWKRLALRQAGSWILSELWWSSGWRGSYILWWWTLNIPSTASCQDRGAAAVRGSSYCCGRTERFRRSFVPTAIFFYSILFLFYNFSLIDSWWWRGCTTPLLSLQGQRATVQSDTIVPVCFCQPETLQMWWAVFFVHTNSHRLRSLSSFVFMLFCWMLFHSIHVVSDIIFTIAELGLI